jgi:hypothetical protein
MNIDSNSEQAIRRDRFMSLWRNVSEAFLYNNAKAAQIALTEAVLEYAAPELELPDFELAKSLKKIDDELITKINYNHYFPSDKSLLKGKLPSWAINYLNEISSGPSVPKDPQRETFFHDLCGKYPLSMEARLLLASVLIQKGCHKPHNEKDFRAGLDLLDQLSDMLPPLKPKAEIYRIGSLYEESPHQILVNFKVWAIENFITFLISNDRLGESIKLIETEKNKTVRDRLKSIYERLLMEKNWIDRLKKIEDENTNKIQKIQEESYNKHIEILTIFLALISIAGGGLVSYFTSGMSSPKNFHAMFEFTLCLLLAMSIGLAFLAQSSKQVWIRLGTGVVSLLILLVSLYEKPFSELIIRILGQP